MTTRWISQKYLMIMKKLRRVPLTKKKLEKERSELNLMETVPCSLMDEVSDNTSVENTNNKNKSSGKAKPKEKESKSVKIVNNTNEQQQKRNLILV
eukprot:UN29747